jgi:hypothetical protein
MPSLESMLLSFKAVVTLFFIFFRRSFFRLISQHFFSSPLFTQVTLFSAVVVVCFYRVYVAKCRHQKTTTRIKK